MNLEQQVCSLNLAKRLKSLNVKQESLFYWVFDDLVQEWIIKDEVRNSNKVEWYSAFTVAELGEMLPTWFRTGKNAGAKGKWIGGFWCASFEGRHHKTGDTEADARGHMLAYLIENNLLPPNQGEEKDNN